MSDQRTKEVPNESPTYFDVVDALTDRFPILFYVSAFVKRQVGQPAFPVRAAVLEFTEGQARRKDFKDSDSESGYDKLQAYLSSSSHCRHRLYIVEDLDAAFIELLGAYLNVDGTVFASQIRDTHTFPGAGNMVINHSCLHFRILRRRLRCGIMRQGILTMMACQTFLPL